MAFLDSDEQRVLRVDQVLLHELSTTKIVHPDYLTLLRKYIQNQVIYKLEFVGN